MTRVTRRTFLKISSSGAAVASSGGMAAILATGQAPAYAQQRTVHWLRWNDFVPASDQLLRDSILPEAQRALGFQIRFETVNGNDLAPRVTAGIQSGSGPDLIMVFNNTPQLYAESLVDVSDITNDIASKQGNFYTVCRNNTFDGSKWISTPFCIVGAQIAYRKSWFEAIGYNKFPETWDEYRDAGKKLKAKGQPLGQAAGHSFGDPPAFFYPYLWSWGGAEVAADGKTVTINSKETVDSIRYMVGFWKDAFDEGGLAWDDSNNNRAFLSGTIAATLNGASIYIESLRNADRYQTDKGAQMRTDILHAALPKGPAGQFAFHTFQSHMLMKYSKNVDATKDFLRWIHTPANYDKWFRSQKGFATGPTTEWEKSTMWEEDPVMAPYRVAGRLGLTVGHRGLAGKAAAEALNKYIVVDMYAKALQGMAPEAAAKWAEDELKKVYV
jgi:multiple sugar transport system substrate-binding protein